MATNGTLSTDHHPLLSPSSPSDEHHEEGPDCSTPNPTLQLLPTAIDTHIQGRNSHAPNNAPAWNPAALLQPNRKAPAPAQFANARLVPSPTPRQAPQKTAQPSSSSSMVFQFSSPNGTPSAGPSSDASTPVSSDTQSAVVPVNWVDKIHNVQSRSEVPEAKRRRVDSDDGQNGTDIPVRGSSGILGQYVKDKRQESGASAPQSMPQSMTVDLTSGMYPISLSPPMALKVLTTL